MYDSMKKGISRVRSLNWPNARRRSSKASFDELVISMPAGSTSEDSCVENIDSNFECSPVVFPPPLLGFGGVTVVDNTLMTNEDYSEKALRVEGFRDLGLDESGKSFSSDCSIEPPNRGDCNDIGHQFVSVGKLKVSPAVLSFMQQVVNKRVGGNPTSSRENSSIKAKKASKEEERGRVVSEVLTSEVSFRDFLHALQSVYNVRLRKELSAEQHKLCFSSVDQLYNFSVTFISELEKDLAESSPEKVCIGKLYCRLSPFFKMYKAYSSTHCQVAEVVDDLCRRKGNFRRLCDECKSDPLCKNQTLQSMLIMPIQRIPRHVLLLKELLKHTPEDHMDRKNIETALQALCDIAQGMNQEIGDTENSIKILEIQQSMTPRPELFQTGRIFVRSGTLKKRGDHGGLQDLVFFLFSDCLVYAKPIALGIGGAKYQFRRMIQISRVSSLDQVKNRGNQEVEIEEEDEALLPLASPCEVMPFQVENGDLKNTSIDRDGALDSFSSSESSVDMGLSPLLSPTPSAGPSTPNLFPTMVSRITGSVKENNSKKDDLFPFQVHGTKTIVLYANSEAERQSWISDMELNSDPNIETDQELIEREREEERKRAMEEVEEKMRNIRVSDPVRVYSATAWFKLNEGELQKEFVETPELQLKFLVSKTGSDLCVAGPVRPLSLLSLTLTVLCARNLVKECITVPGKPFHGIYTVVTFGKTVHKTKLYTMEGDPTWMAEFYNMSFVAGFFSTLQIRVKQALQSKPRGKDPCIAAIDIKMQDILGYTGLEICDPDQQSIGLITNSKAIQKKMSKMKQPKGLQVSSTPFLDNYKMNQIRPKNETLPLSCKPLPEPPAMPPRPASVRSCCPGSRLSSGSAMSIVSCSSSESSTSSPNPLCKDQITRLTNRPLPPLPPLQPKPSETTSAV